MLKVVIWIHFTIFCQFSNCCAFWILFTIFRRWSHNIDSFRTFINSCKFWNWNRIRVVVNVSHINHSLFYIKKDKKFFSVLQNNLICSGCHDIEFMIFKKIFCLYCIISKIKVLINAVKYFILRFKYTLFSVTKR